MFSLGFIMVCTTHRGGYVYVLTGVYYGVYYTQRRIRICSHWGLLWCVLHTEEDTVYVLTGVYYGVYYTQRRIPYMFSLGFIMVCTTHRGGYRICSHWGLLWCVLHTEEDTVYVLTGVYYGVYYTQRRIPYMFSLGFIMVCTTHRGGYRICSHWGLLWCVLHTEEDTVYVLTGVYYGVYYTQRRIPYMFSLGFIMVCTTHRGGYRICSHWDLLWCVLHTEEDTVYVLTGVYYGVYYTQRRIPYMFSLGFIMVCTTHRGGYRICSHWGLLWCVLHTEEDTVYVLTGVYYGVYYTQRRIPYMFSLGFIMVCTTHRGGYRICSHWGLLWCVLHTEEDTVYVLTGVYYGVYYTQRRIPYMFSLGFIMVCTTHRGGYRICSHWGLLWCVLHTEEDTVYVLTGVYYGVYYTQRRIPYMFSLGFIMVCTTHRGGYRICSHWGLLWCVLHTEEDTVYVLTGVYYGVYYTQRRIPYMFSLGFIMVCTTHRGGYRICSHWGLLWCVLHTEEDTVYVLTGVYYGVYYTQRRIPYMFSLEFIMVCTTHRGGYVYVLTGVYYGVYYTQRRIRICSHWGLLWCVLHTEEDTVYVLTGVYYGVYYTQRRIPYMFSLEFIMVCTTHRGGYVYVLTGVYYGVYYTQRRIPYMFSLGFIMVCTTHRGGYVYVLTGVYYGVYYTQRRIPYMFSLEFIMVCTTHRGGYRICSHWGLLRCVLHTEEDTVYVLTGVYYGVYYTQRRIPYMFSLGFIMVCTTHRGGYRICSHWSLLWCVLHTEEDTVYVLTGVYYGVYYTQRRIPYMFSLEFIMVCTTHRGGYRICSHWGLLWCVLHTEEDTVYVLTGVYYGVYYTQRRIPYMFSLEFIMVCTTHRGGYVYVLTGVYYGVYYTQRRIPYMFSLGFIMVCVVLIFFFCL